MKLKNLFQLKSVCDIPVFLAPMAGVTDYAFREICRRQGADMTYSEMISAKGLKYNSKRTFELADVHGDEKIAIQLFGRDPQDIGYAITLLEDKQGENVRCFDINMGCPAPKIVNNGEGAALMKEPLLAAKIVEKAKKSTALPITVKFRKGFDAFDCNYLQFARIIQQAGADAITIHGRLRDQFYSGKADWKCIEEVKSILHIPVIANGDVFSPEDARQIQKQTGADGIMVARGATGNPFLFRQIKQYLQTGSYSKIDLTEKAETMLLQAELCSAVKGEQRAMRELRKHMAWYLKGIRKAAVWKQQALGLTSIGELKELIKQVVISSTLLG